MSTSPMTILVVDDDKSSVLMLRKLLQHHGYQVQTAHDGHAALARIAEQRPDLILLDIMMPGLNGYDVLSHLQENPQNLNIPVLFMTAKTELSEEDFAMGLGAEGFLTKPLQLDVLLDHVRGALAPDSRRVRSAEPEEKDEKVRATGAAFETAAPAEASPEAPAESRPVTGAEVVCVLGLGQIGLATAVRLAEAGFHVVGCDADPQVVAAVGEVRAPGLAEAVAGGRLRVATTALAADVFVIAVPTPLDRAIHPDLRFVRAAAEAIAGVIRPGNLVIVESTVPPTTTERVVIPLIESSSRLRAGRDFQVAAAPEGADGARVIGGFDQASAERARQIYARLGHGAVSLTDLRTAELTRLMANTYHDVNAALANEFALLAEELGVDVWEAIALANRDPAVAISRPGPGAGGHCVVADPWFVVDVAPKRAKLIVQAREVNDLMPAHVAARVYRELKALPHAPSAAILGLACRPGSDDIRDSPALAIIEELLEHDVMVRVYDPVVESRANARQLGDLEATLRDADCLVLVTDHADFLALDPETVGQLMHQRLVFDTRNALDHARWRAAGFRVLVLGNGKRPPPGG